MISVVVTGNGNYRKVLVSSEAYCFMLFWHRANDISIWSDGLSIREGKDLVDIFERSGVVSYNKLLKTLMHEYENLGWSERGAYTIESFTELLSEINEELGGHAMNIYNKLINPSGCGIYYLGGKDEKSKGNG